MTVLTGRQQYADREGGHPRPVYRPASAGQPLDHESGQQTADPRNQVIE
ncbi:MAG: hypothetical protein ACXWNX_01970 [Isosphaeraceae bacterium]|jgi:hypothetical protein